jgi:outer membrane usher protein
MGADPAGTTIDNTIPAVGAKQPPGDRSPANQTREELFLEVFKHPPPNIPVSSYVFVVVDGAARQKVKAVLSPGGQDISVEGKLVVAFLAHLLRPDIVQRLERKIDSQGWLNRAALEEAGISTSFNLRKFELSLETTPGMREARIQYLNNPMTDPLSVEAIRPARVSGFLNLNLKGVARTETVTTATSNLTDVAFAADGAMNVGGVVLEGSAFGQSGNERSVQRGNVRLVYDLPQRALRFTAGDLSYPVVGYQTVVNMGGIGFSKDFSLQPHVPTYRTSEFDFYLERPAEVKVWVNNSLVNTLQLPAGAHDIRGLMPAVGQNDIDLVIEDNAGRRQILHFSFIYDPVLLNKGRSLFSYNAGFRRELKNGVYEYDLKKPVLSASYLKGLTDETTLGAYTQADTARALFGARALHILPLGTLQLDTAVSRSDRAPWDAGVKLALTSAPAKNGRPGVQSQVSVEYLGRNFGSIDAVSPAPGDAFNYLAALAVPLGQGVTGQLSGNYTSARASGVGDSYGAAATLNRRWGRYTTANLSLRRHRTNRSEPETQLLFGLSISFAKGAGSFYAAKELESNTVASTWDSGRPSNASTPYAFESTRVGPDNREYKGGGGYWGNQGLAEASYTRDEIDQGTSRYTRDEMAVRLQSTLVFADGTLALARPVAENFAIVAGQEGLANVAMKVDPDGLGGSRARSDWLSPAVLTDLSSYRLRDVRVEPVNPPLGATPDKTTFLLAPTYKSGFLLKLGKELSIVAVGRLVDEQRKPLAHLPIEIQRLDRPEEKSVSTFTSRGGGFQVPDIRPGRYEIRAADRTRGGRTTVEIPATPDGLYRLGDVVLSSGT